MSDLYQEEILDHYKNPRNFGELDGADKSVRESNASCGDMIEIYLKFENQKSKIKNQKELVIEDVKFRGVGCAVSMAAASMLTEKIRNENSEIREILSWDEKTMVELMGTEVGAARKKCVMLALRAVKRAVDES